MADDEDASGNDPSPDTVIAFDWYADKPSLIASLLNVPLTIGQTAHSITVGTNSVIGQDRVVVTVKATDHGGHAAGHTTSTSFVLDLIPNSNSEPSVTVTSNVPSNTFLENTSPTQSSTYHFDVSPGVPSDGTTKQNLVVTAESSNASLVPNDPVNNLKVNRRTTDWSGDLTITPLPLPLTQQGKSIPQSTTITLNVIDNAYTTRRTQFLYVVRNKSSFFAKISRPSGVYSRDADDGFDRSGDLFLTGEMHYISWDGIDNGDPDYHNWNWSSVDDLLGPQGTLPSGQLLSINLIEVPGFVNAAAGMNSRWCGTGDHSWLCVNGCDEGSWKAAPWDSNLQLRREYFLQQLSAHPTRQQYTVATDPRVAVINPNLPGGDTGIHDGTVLLSSMCGYNRQILLQAAVHELRTVQTWFPKQLVQFGLFTVDDTITGNPLWYWIYDQLAKIFDGTRNPRVTFFQEDLAATRLNGNPDYVQPHPFSAPRIYSFTPDFCQLPAFRYNCGTGDCNPNVSCTPADRTYNNPSSFQSNTIWSGPFAGFVKTENTINGTPNDGMEAAFNAYYSEYLEVYSADLDHAQVPPGSTLPTAWDHLRWAAGLQSWHDYAAYLQSLAPMEGPAGLTVARSSSSNNTISWYAAYGAGTYTLQRKSLSPPGSWTNVTGCDPTATTCTDTAPTGSQYAYRVQASDATGLNLSTWSQVAVFLSESKNDGYIAASDTSYTRVANDSVAGIQAGQGDATDLGGFLSFNTSSLGAGVTVLGATLRLKQASDNDGFDYLGPCLADIATGDFNDSAKLEGADFDAPESDYDVTEEGALAAVDAENWVAAELDPAYVTDVATTDRTQFRLYFDHIDGFDDTSAAWYSSESVGNEPELIVQYSEEE